jgi:hypothetical protein
MDMTEDRRDEIRQIIYSGYNRVEVKYMARAAECSQSNILAEIAQMKAEGMLP